MNRFRIPLVALAATLVTGLAQAHDLTVKVLNARSEQGSVAAALYDSEAGWQKTPVGGERQPASPDASVLVFRNLAPGRYALAVFHDENGNGRLDSNVAGVPTERYGFSRDARGRMGAPAFGDAAIEVSADTAVTIHLR